MRNLQVQPSTITKLLTTRATMPSPGPAATSSADPGNSHEIGGAILGERRLLQSNG